MGNEQVKTFPTTQIKGLTHISSSRLQLSPVQESFRKIHMSTSQELSHVFRKEIICTGTADASVEMVMEEKMHRPNVRQFESILHASAR